MQELDCEESWALKNWCFWTVVLEKTLESPLDCKEIQPVHSKEDQSWVFFGRNDAKAETPVLWPLHAKSYSLKRLWCWEGLGARGKGDDRGWDGWMASLTWWTWVWVNSGDGDGQSSLALCDSWGHKKLDTTEWLNWTELNWKGDTMCLTTSQDLPHWHPSWQSNVWTTRKDPELEWLAIFIKAETVSHEAQQFSWFPIPYCSPPCSLSSKISCFVSMYVFSSNSLPSVRQEPIFGPWKGSPFLQQFIFHLLGFELCKKLKNIVLYIS